MVDSTSGLIGNLNDWVDHEVQWLSYYSTSESRSKLTLDSEIYLDLVTMGYCKKPTPLYIRCSICLLSNGSKIDKNTDISTIKTIHRVKTDVDYTPLELFLIIYPTEKERILNRLRPTESEWKPFIFNRW